MYGTYDFRSVFLFSSTLLDRGAKVSMDDMAHVMTAPSQHSTRRLLL